MNSTFFFQLIEISLNNIRFIETKILKGWQLEARTKEYQKFQDVIMKRIT